MKKEYTVSRSVYQKLAEENKKLKADIKVLVNGDLPASVLLRHKYKQEYDKEDAFKSSMHLYAKQYFKDHPEQDVMSPKYNPDSLNPC